MPDGTCYNQRMVTETLSWQSQYNLLFRTTSDGVIALDHTGLLLRINPAAAGMLRCVPEECIGKTPKSVFHDQPALLDLLEGRGENVRKVILPGKRVAHGISEIQPDDTRMVLLRDITEREELDTRRDQLIAAIGHDLRNPISAIHGFAELIPLSGSLTSDQERFVTRIIQTSQKMQYLASTLVDLAWIESGMPMESVPVELDKVITLAVSELDKDAQQKRMSIAISTQHPLPFVMGDPARLKQVVVNLLQNAIQYSEPEQPIAIHAFEYGQQVRCTVGDRGIGIHANELDQVFDRLYRSPDEAVRKTQGGGIGLTMARVILRRHGGSIAVSSVYGEGSTFIFTLPLAG